MDTLKNLNYVSAFFFFVFAGGYVAMALLLRNEFMPETLLNLMRLLDLPAAFVALAYGGSALSLQVSQGREKPSRWVMLIAFVCIGLLTTLTVIQLTFPGQI